MKEAVFEVLNDMSEVLTLAQLKKLQAVLLKRFREKESNPEPARNEEYLDMYIQAKTVEGLSERTISYYKSSISHLLGVVTNPVRSITTEQIRLYLSDYQKINNCGKTTIDNIRRNISSFFSWLEEEDHILKSPVRRIHKIKSKTPVKDVITDEEIERMRDGCTASRDVAIIELLYSTGMRVGELVQLDRRSVDFIERECVVFGKGGKERKVYFDARTKLHLQEYLDQRIDDNPALFVTLDAPYNRLHISGVEIRLRQLGKKLDLHNIHPHKFRRTMATRAIDKGMPIEQLQKLLGHSQIDTTMQYAIVNQNNVKAAHRKFIS